MTTAIQFKQVSKKFTLNQNRPQSWQEMLLRLSKRPQRAELEKRNFWVLKDISFEKDSVLIPINPEIYPLDVIYTSAYVFIDRAYVIIDGNPKKEVIVKWF